MSAEGQGLSRSKGGSRVFVSHANADGEYLKKFVTHILLRGADLCAPDVFYSSAADMGVASGQHLMERVRTEASDSELIIAMVTPMYQARPVCVAELGAAWARGVLFPLLAPGMDRSDLEGVLPGLMIKPADDENVLDELADRIRGLGFEFQATSFGEGKVDWKSDLRRGLAPARLDLPPSADDMKRLARELESTQSALDKKTDELEELRNRHERLLAAKTGAEAREADLPTDERERFDALCTRVTEALLGLSNPVRDAVWHDVADQEMFVPERFDSPDECDAIDDERKNGLLIVDEETGVVSPDSTFPRVRRARDAVAELDQYLVPQERSEAFSDWFKQEYETPMDLKKKACWNAVI
ncbi:toll/interleukin-1 receptor domain-containing protein [Williamsia sp. 1135]|uniref:toll/interleukin-1 receptor domain-containing protein n=1 Tax=Williamsia sp. 1135 TaxID=1889262 RepID=UPI000A103F5B|nr:toll/interleukin-1 receptor domain-containing protein [Williamsia sp. 1135]ORM37079.1 hypothetical protein BFL43_05435 [Williamsia sp. 1135]